MVLEYIRQYIDLLRYGRLIDDVHDDIRTVEEKSRDYVYGVDIRLPASAISKRIKKAPFEPYDQQQTSACGAYSAAHVRRLERRETTFPLVWYRARSNYGLPGMFLKDVLEMAAYADTFLEPANLPSMLTEDYASSMPYTPVISNKDKTREYFYIKPYDVEGVWEAVSNGHPTVISFYSTVGEWTEEMIPTDTVWESTARVRHYVVALPNSIHERGGHEWVTVIDSSRQGNMSLRHIRKDFLAKRMYIGGGFVTTVKTSTTKPKTLPTHGCQFNDKSTAVLELQDYLVSQGLMDTKHRTSYYGNITAKAVLKWQVENIKNVNIAELMYLEGKHWGPLSIKTVIDKHTNV